MGCGILSAPILRVKNRRRQSQTPSWYTAFTVISALRLTTRISNCLLRALLFCTMQKTPKVRPRASFFGATQNPLYRRVLVCSLLILHTSILIRCLAVYVHMGHLQRYVITEIMSKLFVIRLRRADFFVGSIRFADENPIPNAPKVLRCTL